MSAAETAVFIRQIADALGIPYQRIQKLVIVADAHDIVRVYVKFVQPVESTRAIVEVSMTSTCPPMVS